MTDGLTFTPAAEADLTAVFAWYEEQRRGLGERFMTAVEDLMLTISQSPRMFPEVIGGYRRGLLRRFPYGVYFSCQGEHAIVHAVLHLHRDPVIWRERLTRGSR